MRHTKDHEDALRDPKPGFERGIVWLWTGLAELAKAHHDRYGVFISEDSYMGEAWSQILSSAHNLLNGETGRLAWSLIPSAIWAEATSVDEAKPDRGLMA